MEGRVNGSGRLSNTTPDTQDLLCYLSEYKVLICKECRFAIQPSALSSHLLKHGFYRGNRKKLTKHLSELDLAEPEDVRSPGPDDNAVSQMPVHEGLICEYEDCNHACMAEKRMSAHWREVHDRHNLGDVRARKARLQTFFRGSKTRYFEVERGLPASTARERDQPPTVNTNHAEKFYEALVKEEEESCPGLPDLQLQDLDLLHHWHVHTSKTMGRGHQDSNEFWAETVTNEALKYDFVMRAIFTMAGVHKTYLTIKTGGSPQEAQRLYTLALSHHFIGLKGFRAALGQGVTAENAIAFAASARLFGLGIGAGVVADKHLHDGELPGSRELLQHAVHGVVEFLMLVRGSMEIQMSAQHVFPPGSPFQISPEVLEAAQFPSPSSTSSPLNYRLNPCSTAAHAVQLQSTDTEAIDSAISSLSLCYEEFRAEKKFDSMKFWVRAEMWPRLISESFIYMLQGEDPAALVVYVHWCLLIRKMAEEKWYLEGTAERLIGLVVKGLGRGNPLARERLEGALGETEALL